MVSVSFWRTKAIKPLERSSNIFDLVVIRCFAGMSVLSGFYFAVFLVKEAEFYLQFILQPVRCSTAFIHNEIFKWVLALTALCGLHTCGRYKNEVFRIL